MLFSRFYEPVKFQPNIIPVCVPDSDEDLVGSKAWVTGWGRLYEGETVTSVASVTSEKSGDRRNTMILHVKNRDDTT